MGLKELNKKINEEYERDTVTKIIQPEDMFKLLKVENVEEAKRVFNVALSFLVYLRPGEALETSHARFIKIDEDMIQVNSKLDSNDTIDSLSKKRIIKFLFC